MDARERHFRVHLTNIAGTGAVQLAASLLPALERAPGHRLDQIHLPDRGEMAAYRRSTEGAAPLTYRRRLPNALSRVIECLVGDRRFDGDTPLLVLGDLPIRCNARQIVFVQTPHLLLPGERGGSGAGDLKYRIARAIFRANLRYAHAFIVQTDTMKAGLERSHPQVRGRVRIVGQPAPAWLLGSGLRRTGRGGKPDDLLTLFYPAAPYPHKNHRLLSQIRADTEPWPVESLVLTVADAAHPNPPVGWIRCVGLLPPGAIVERYRHADALVFLSVAESYGLPLVEAMSIGLPIVCPDLPYARSLCGAQALYFDPQHIDTLRVALESLKSRLRAGWWPDWSERLKALPNDWSEVAAAMLDICFGAGRADTGGPAPGRETTATEPPCRS